MPQPDKQPWRKLRSRGVRATDLDKLLNAFRALDRTVVEISMKAYNVPRRDRAADARTTPPPARDGSRTLATTPLPV